MPKMQLYSFKGTNLESALFGMILILPSTKQKSPSNNLPQAKLTTKNNNNHFTNNELQVVLKTQSRNRFSIANLKQSLQHKTCITLQQLFLGGPPKRKQQSIMFVGTHIKALGDLIPCKNSNLHLHKSKEDEVTK